MKNFKQNGQTIVEFAMILPIFFLITFGFIYLAMFFVDYTTLNNIARNETRRAIVNEISDATYVIKPQNPDSQLILLNSYYQFGNADENEIEYELKTQSGIKTVTINAERRVPDSSFLTIVLPEKYAISYSMYGE